MKEICDDENNLIDINQLEFLSNIGQEYRVFKYDKDVIKIFKKDYKLEHTSKKIIEYLKKIETKRILMPTGFIKDKDNNLIGYKMKYVSGNRFLNEDYVEDFFMELTIIKDDIEMLSNNGVRLLDINKNNTIYNGGVYMIDPGNYKIDKNMANENIKEWNYNKINILLDQLLFSQKYNPYMFRQIVQFLMKERKEKNIIYNQIMDSPTYQGIELAEFVGYMGKRIIEDSYISTRNLINNYVQTKNLKDTDKEILANFLKKSIIETGFTEKYIDNINVFVTYKNYQDLEKGLMYNVKQTINESLKKFEEEEFE